MKRKHLKLEFQDLSTEEKISSFEKTFSIISEMRKLRNAPVDTMVKKKIINTQGSEAISDRKDPQIFRYHVLISVMLSSQTKDEVTAKAMSNLKNYGLTIDNILSTDQVKIEELIYPVGFYKRKAKYILETTKILKEKFNSDIPRSMEEIKSLKGVGPKMAQIVKNVGWNDNDGIAVDVHVHRICNRLHWVQTKKPEETQKELEKFVPKKYFEDFNVMIVGFGQQICKSKPMCNSCLLKDVCPSFESIEIKKKKD